MPAVRRTVHLAYTMGHTAGVGRRRCATTTSPPTPLRLARSLHALRPDDSECAGLLALVAADRGPGRRPVGADGVPGRARRRRPLDVGPRRDRRGAGARRRAGARSGRPARRGRPRSPPSTPGRPTFDDTDWRRILGHYDALLTRRAEPDDRRRSVRRRCRTSLGAGGRARRPRRGARPRRPRRLPVRPRRPGPAARAPRPTPTRRRRRGGQRDGVRPDGRRAGVAGARASTSAQPRGRRARRRSSTGRRRRPARG